MLPLVVITLGFGLNAFGQGKVDWMRITQGKNYPLRLHVRLIADTDDIHLL